MQADVTGCDKGRGTPGDWTDNLCPLKVQGIGESPGIWGNENCYVDVHVPVKKALDFLQIICRVFSPLQKVRNNCKGESFKVILKTQSQWETRLVETWGRLWKGEGIEI